MSYRSNQRRPGVPLNPPEYDEFDDFELSQHNLPVPQQPIPRNRRSPPQNRYVRYSEDEEDGSFGITHRRSRVLDRRVGNWDGDFNEDEYYDQFGYQEFDECMPSLQRFTQRGRNQVGSGYMRYNDIQQDDCGGYMEQHGSDDNSINEKLDTILELMKDIQKGNEARDKEIKALSQQVGQLTEEVAIIKRDQSKLRDDIQRDLASKSSNTEHVHINAVSTRPLSEISVVETHSLQCVEGVGNKINESKYESEHDQENKSFTKSKNGSNEKFFEIDNFNVKVPYPEALLAHVNLSKREPPRGERWESFEKVKINKLLLKEIKENPDHVDYFEELNTHKRHHKFPKQLELTASVNAVLMGTLPPKTQDPGTPVVSIQIGNVKLDNSLLDLGACVSILPGSLFDQYDFGPLQKVKTTVVLADQTPICHRGIVRNVIVKVGEFFYPVDFLVLDCAKNSQPTVILGRPFLTTTKAIINCAEGTVRMRFGDKKMSLKLFTNSPNHKIDKCGSPEKGNQTEKKECFVIDRVHGEKAKKKTRKRKRKKDKKIIEFDCYREACRFYDQVWDEADNWYKTCSGAEGSKHPTRPP